jgi:hypothetical protein
MLQYVTYRILHYLIKSIESGISLIFISQGKLMNHKLYRGKIGNMPEKITCKDIFHSG